MFISFLNSFFSDMGSIYSKEAREKRKKRGPRLPVKLNLIVLGDPGVGKSALTFFFVYKKKNPSTLSLEDSYRTTINLRDGPRIVDIFDTSGSLPYYSTLRDEYFRIADGFCFVYSITSRESFKVIRGLHESSIRWKAIDTIPAILVGNKSDLEDEHRQVSFQEGQEMADQMNMPFLETSAKEGDNVDRMFEIVASTILHGDKFEDQPLQIKGARMKTARREEEEEEEEES